VVYFYQTLEIQPFTHLRGALVQGSDTLRHILNLVNNGGNFCLNFLDLIFSGINEWTLDHTAGYHRPVPAAHRQRPGKRGIKSGTDGIIPASRME
jgi:hypothetical protein